ncbi:MAG: isoleucine--tRNA ligase [Bacteroidales bacterium]|nr:isoleucine--tRNA ligase [Bacteroidales bacterium]
MAIYNEYKQLSLTRIGEEVLKFWEEQSIFHKSLETRKDSTPFVFYEGPPSANGVPGIHHVMARAIKDVFCRYKTLKGFHVTRKAGWDTHGLPVELAVEKKLGITKEDIGKAISIEDYNKECRTEVMKYTGLWEELTQKMGYWVDMSDPYVTYENKYIETIWWLLNELYKKDLLYKGYTIQPYSPAAGTGLSTHELNQPGCYRSVKDTTLVAQFKVVRNNESEKLFSDVFGDLFFLAWTTTPWTLPSNTALCVGKNISYAMIKTFNPYTFEPITVILGKETVAKYFNPENLVENSAALILPEDKKNLPYQLVCEVKGSDLEGCRYEQLLPYAQPEEGDAFRVITGDFVTTEDGTGIVHIAPSFGADDFRVAKQNGIGALTMVDKTGRFVAEMGEFAGRFVKPEYDASTGSASGSANSVDVDIVVKLKHENRAFKSEKYEHSYPHCWRTDKPILYYPLDSWFIKTTAFKERMIELNKTIHWKPEATGTGRFGNWLENLVDWNLSRSRYWGVPLPIWTTEDKMEQICIGSVEQLQQEIEKSIKAGFIKASPLKDFKANDFSKENYDTFDLHRPYVDEIILVSPSGQKMFREADLIDVWFDSGAMPYAQYHYPFETDLKGVYPADFIAEGVDQTRGWFFTLHAIATMLFDSVAYKAVVSNGLVLDKAGNKMSKRLNNAVDPFETIAKYGPDATRWYMITNAQPWDNLKFDIEGIPEVQRKFFGTLYNTYSFFALYANIDKFEYKEADIAIEKRPEIDRWILSELNTLIKYVDECYADYEPTKAGRAIQDFVDAHLSNWYVRLCRRRFWKGEYSDDKISAYQTLYTCLNVIAKLMSPIAPFFAERLYLDLNHATKKEPFKSVHLTDFPAYNEKFVDKNLEERMQLAQQISSMALSLRKRSNVRVRQPLQKILIPVVNKHLQTQIEDISHLILSEVNIKNIEFLTETGFLTKKIKANFKQLGPKYSTLMKPISAAIAAFTQSDIQKMEADGNYMLTIENQPVEILISDVDIITEDIPGWVVANEGTLTVALDVTISDELREEGISRELVNRIQTIRKEQNFGVTDKIKLIVEKNNEINLAIQNNFAYICTETLAESLDLVDKINHPNVHEIELTENLKTRVVVEKI